MELQQHMLYPDFGGLVKCVGQVLHCPTYNHVLNFCTIIRTITKSVIRKAYKVYSVNRYLRNLDLNTAYDFALRIAEGREFHRLAPYMLKDNFLTCKRHLGTCS